MNETMGMLKLPPNEPRWPTMYQTGDNSVKIASGFGAMPTHNAGPGSLLWLRSYIETRRQVPRSRPLVLAAKYSSMPPKATNQPSYICFAYVTPAAMLFGPHWIGMIWMCSTPAQQFTEYEVYWDRNGVLAQQRGVNFEGPTGWKST